MIKRSIEKKTLLLLYRTNHCAKKAFTDKRLMMLRIIIYIDLTNCYNYLIYNINNIKYNLKCLNFVVKFHFNIVIIYVFYIK